MRTTTPSPSSDLGGTRPARGAILAEHRRAPLDVRCDWRRRCGKDCGLDETGCVVEDLCSGGTIGIAPFHGDLDIDCAVRKDYEAGIRQIDLVRLCRDRTAEK
jgi:hypothetical protein